MLLLDGSFAATLLHRDPSYMEAAGEAAHALIGAALSPGDLNPGLDRRRLEVAPRNAGC